MTRTQTIDSIQAKLDAMSDEQLAALDHMATAYARAIPAEDDRTRAAIAIGVAEAKAGKRVPQSELDRLLKQPWR